MLALSELLEGKDLYHTKFPEGWEFLWRLLTLKEYRIFSALRSSQVLAEEYLYYEVFERVYQGDPKLINQTMPVGVICSIGRLAMWLSGDCSPQTLPGELEQMRTQYQPSESYEVFKRVILTALPVYRLDELDAMNRLELLRLFVVAEAAIKARVENYQPVSFVEPKAPPPRAVPINFEAENAAIQKQLHPWDIADMIEDNHEASTARRISTDVAKKLDERRAKGR